MKNGKRISKVVIKCDLINHRAIAGCERQFQYCPYCGCNLAIVRSKATCGDLVASAYGDPEADAKEKTQ